MGDMRYTSTPPHDEELVPAPEPGLRPRRQLISEMTAQRRPAALDRRPKTAHSLRTWMIQDDGMEVDAQNAPQQTIPFEATSGDGDVERTVSGRAEPDPAGYAPPPDWQVLLSVTDVARCLHIGRRQAWEMVWRGELPVVRLGPRTVRVARAVLEHFVLDRSRPYGS